MVCAGTVLLYFITKTFEADKIYSYSCCLCAETQLYVAWSEFLYQRVRGCLKVCVCWWFSSLVGSSYKMLHVKHVCSINDQNGWRIWTDDELRDMYRKPDIVTAIKARRLNSINLLIFVFCYFNSWNFKLYLHLHMSRMSDLMPMRSCWMRFKRGSTARQNT